MTQHYKTATVFGGTGFVGRQIVRELAQRGIIVKVATRIPERAYFLKPCGAPGQVVPFGCDYSDDQSIADAVKGSDYVINCIGILFQRGKARSFQRLHVDVPARIAAAASKEGVQKLVHISALGVERATSKYAKTKLEGEQAVLSNCATATILRPSVIFGEDDNFFNMFAEMARYLPVLPLIGGGKTQFQPVYVGDVADAVMAALGGTDAEGRTYELGGPEVVSFKEIYERLFELTERRRALVGLPFFLAKVQAFFMGLLPVPPLTPDQVESLKTDSIVTPGVLGFEALGLAPTSMGVILPTYLKSYCAGGRFANIQEA